MKQDAGADDQGNSIYFPGLRKLPDSGEFSNRQVEKGGTYVSFHSSLFDFFSCN
jgi:hypothetical protein